MYSTTISLAFSSSQLCRMFELSHTLSYGRMDSPACEVRMSLTNSGTVPPSLLHLPNGSLKSLVGSKQWQVAAAKPLYFSDSGSNRSPSLISFFSTARPVFCASFTMAADGDGQTEPGPVHYTRAGGAESTPSPPTGATVVPVVPAPIFFWSSLSSSE